MRKYLTIVYILISCTGIQAGKMTFDDLYSVAKISDPQISPDGNRAAFTLTRNNLETNKSFSHIWIINSDGSGMNQYTSGERSCFSPRWSPDGSQLYFLSAVEKSGLQLCTFDPDRKTVKTISSAYSGVGDITLLPDGTGCLFVSSVLPDCPDDSCNRTRDEAKENNPVKAKLYDHLLYRHYNRWFDGKVEQVLKLNFNDGRHTKLFPTPFGDHNTIFSDYGVSPDGQEICVSMNIDTMPAVYVNYDLFTL
ncbi:MAG: TolB family protein, partial [Candidatus Zixiibacteriota bacterium]